MGVYAGSNLAWIDEIYQFEETDVVQGGAGGIDNVPLKNLADRTAWLKAQIGRFNRLEGEVILTISANIPPTLAGSLIIGYATGVMNLTIEDAATFPHGAIIPITSYCEPNSVINILTSAGQTFYNPVDGVSSVINMHHNEHIVLVALSDHFKVLVAHGNFYRVGEELKARKVLNNTVALEGQLLQRSLFPRLWRLVQSLTVGQQVTDEATWLADATSYRGLFTPGNGATTFRVPDERGMFERMLDLGRGISTNRPHNYPGGYEKDAIVNHYHNVNPNPNANSQSGFGKITTGGDGVEGVLPIIKSSGPYNPGNDAFIGSNETVVKNIGKYNLIRF